MADVVLVPGTHSWRNDGKREWYYPNSEFAAWLTAHGINVVADPTGEPFIWSTDVGGVGFGDGDRVGWAAAGRQLFWWCVPPRCPENRIPPQDLIVIAHSHGMQVALYAAAQGLKIAHLITMAGPVRKDMRETTAIARTNIAYWTHVHSDRSDWMQVFGGLFDGHFGIQRKHPAADRNIFVRKVGHSKLLREPDFQVWREILDKLLTVPTTVVPPLIDGH